MVGVSTGNGLDEREEASTCREKATSCMDVRMVEEDIGRRAIGGRDIYKRESPGVKYRRELRRSECVGVNIPRSTWSCSGLNILTGVLLYSFLVCPDRI